MNSLPYIPIDCNYYDLLEIAAMRRKEVEIRYTESGRDTELVINARIEDLWAKNGEEFMRLSNGLTIRLDQLISLDGQVRPESGGSCGVG